MPIVSRELSVLSRRRGTFIWRVLIVLAGILVMAGVLLSGTPPSQQGRLLFSLLSGIALAYCLIAGIFSTADCVSVEKREGTLGLLLLTDLKGFDVIFGKIASSSTNLLYGLLAFFPILAVGILFGGISGEELSRLLGVLVSTLVFSVGIGVLVSTLSRNERKAIFACAVVESAWTALPFFVQYVAAATWNRILADEWLAASPIRGFQLARPAVSGLLPPLDDYLQTVGIITAAGLACVGIASIILPRLSLEKSDAPAAWLRRWNDWIEGAPRARKIRRQRLLEQNPFSWLAGRDRVRIASVWIFLASMGLLIFWLLYYYQEIASDPGPVVLLVFVIQFVLKTWVLAETCTRFVEDRRSGAYELLLSTPLSVREIARGQTIALLRQFGRPILFLIAGEIWLYFSVTRQLHREIQLPLIAFLFDLVALYQVGRWRSLFTNSIVRAWFDTAARVLVLPWVLFLVFGFLQLLRAIFSPGSFLTIESARLLKIWFCVGIMVDLFFAVPARYRFLRYFRQIAAARFTARPGEILSQLDLHAAENRREPGKRIAWAAGLRPRRTVLIALLLMALAVLWAKHAAAHRRLGKKIAAIQRAGEPTTMEEARKWFPAVASEQDGLIALSEAPSKLAVPGVLSMPPPNRTVLTSVAEQMTEASLLRDNADGLAVIHSALKHPRSSFSFADPRFNTLLSRMGAVVRLLIAQSHQSSATNQTAAIDATADLFRLYRLLAGTGSGWQEWAFNVLRCGVLSVERLVNAGTLSDTKIHELLKLLDDTRDPDTWSRLFVLERAQLLSIYRERFFPLMIPIGQKWDMVALGAKIQLGRITGAWDNDGANLVDTLNDLAPLLRAPLPEALDRQEKLIERTRTGQFPHSLYFLNSAGNLNWRRAQETALYLLAETGLAIARYRLDHNGHASETLDELVPRYLNKVPIDPFDGKPLRYLKTRIAAAGGPAVWVARPIRQRTTSRSSASSENREAPPVRMQFLLYSVGENRIDDGGLEASGQTQLGFNPLDTVFVVKP